MTPFASHAATSAAGEQSASPLDVQAQAADSRSRLRFEATLTKPISKDRDSNAEANFAGHVPLRGAQPRAIAKEGAHDQQRRELVDLLRRLCSALYVGERESPYLARTVVALDAAFPGAAAELIREGAFLRVRLLASSHEIRRLMAAQHDVLCASLRSVTSLAVSVDIVCTEGGRDGSPD